MCLGLNYQLVRMPEQPLSIISRVATILCLNNKSGGKVIILYVGLGAEGWCYI